MKSGKRTILAGLFNDRPFNSPNDIVVDNNGRIYFTDPRYFGKESIGQPLDGVYSFDTEGTIHLIIANASKPNGIAISPDYKTLYIANYDLDINNSSGIGTFSSKIDSNVFFSSLLLILL